MHLIKWENNQQIPHCMSQLRVLKNMLSFCTWHYSRCSFVHHPLTSPPGVMGTGREGWHLHPLVSTPLPSVSTLFLLSFRCPHSLGLPSGHFVKFHDGWFVFHVRLELYCTKIIFSWQIFWADPPNTKFNFNPLEINYKYGQTWPHHYALISFTFWKEHIKHAPFK